MRLQCINFQNHILDYVSSVMNSMHYRFKRMEDEIPKKYEPPQQ